MLLPSAMALAAGAMFAVAAGGKAVEILLRNYDWTQLPIGLDNGGAIIGKLERGLIFLLLVHGEAEVIGFRIAAKSILQLDRTSKGIAARQYIIIGTLASFGWAILVAIGTVMLLSALPPLGIPDLSP